MDELDYYRKRFYAFYNALSILEGEDTKIYMDNTWKAGFDAAFEKKDLKYLKALDREITISINEYPLEYRREINRRIEAEVGINVEEVEKKRLKKLQTIIKRGSIRNRDEYELVHSRLDELIHDVAKDDPARHDIPELERIIMDYSTALKSE